VPATIPTMTTWADGIRVAASDFNSQIRDVGAFLLDRPQAFVYRTAITNLPSGGNGTAFPWDTVQVDNNGMFNMANSSRLTFPTAGKYLVYGKGGFGNYAGGIRSASIRLNAAGVPTAGTLLDYDAANPVAGALTQVRQLFARSFAVNDHIELYVFQSSGAGQNTVAGITGGFLAAVWIGT
jgi:hypothetical protein